MPAQSLPSILFAQRLSGVSVAGLTHYATLMMGGYWGSASNHTSEADAEVIYRRAGSIDQFYVNIEQNDTSTNSTYTLRKNAADTSVTVTIPAATTGHFLDAVNTVTVASTDKIAVKIVIGTGGTQYRDGPGIGASFIPSSPTSGEAIGFHTWAAETAQALTSVDRFLAVGGASAMTTFFAIEDVVQHKTVTAVFKNADFLIKANARSTSTTLTLRKNGVDTVLAITVGAGQTGHFENTANPVQFAHGDLVAWRLSFGSDSNGITFEHAKVEAYSDHGQYMLGASRDAALGLSASTSYYMSPIGVIRKTTNSTEDFLRVGTPLYLRRMSMYVNTNTATGTSTCTLRKNNVDTAQTLSIGAGQTGRFEDTTNIVQFSDKADRATIRFDVGTGTGAVLDITSWCFYAEALDTFLNIQFRQCA